MSYESQLQHTVTIKRQNGTDDYGDNTYEADADVKARMVLTDTSTVNGQGETIPIHALLHVLPGTALKAGDSVVYDGTSYRVETVKRTPDGTGQIRNVKAKLQEYSQ